MTIDFLIIGQGLAGSLLAWNLLKAGCTVSVIDDCHPQSATRVGAGIVNPITGPRMAPCWRLEQLLADCRKTYRMIGVEMGNLYYKEKELVRFFKNDEERRLWMQKRSASGTNRYLGSMRPPGVSMRMITIFAFCAAASLMPSMMYSAVATPSGPSRSSWIAMPLAITGDVKSSSNVKSSLRIL